ncbi:hypothetical protein N7456_007419 [Penicillium angulare]|uniref:Uncharacterized protein n=1 Tax=Penicillium angulare TaxID=116970 RepID=A0A9W9FAN2_9EURO|nr:hypothetical protein N7456_007419 [Penicillium angulare]
MHDAYACDQGSATDALPPASHYPASPDDQNISLVIPQTRAGTHTVPPTAADFPRAKPDNRTGKQGQSVDLKEIQCLQDMVVAELQGINKILQDTEDLQNFLRDAVATTLNCAQESIRTMTWMLKDPIMDASTFSSRVHQVSESIADTTESLQSGLEMLEAFREKVLAWRSKTENLFCQVNDLLYGDI